MFWSRCRVIQVGRSGFPTTSAERGSALLSRKLEHCLRSLNLIEDFPMVAQDLSHENIFSLNFVVRHSLPHRLDPSGWRTSRRQVLLGTAATGIALLGGGLASPLLAKSASDRLTFTGPVPVTADSKPWGTAMDGGPREALVRKSGYVEEEHFLSGGANVYGPASQASQAPGQSSFDFAEQLKPYVVK